MDPPRSVPTLVIPSDTRLLPVARAFIAAFCNSQALAGSWVEGLVLAVHEALRNVICHGCDGSSGVYLQLQCYAHPERIEIHVVDSGKPFDPNHVPELDPSELRLGGRGLFLIRKLVDEYTCQRSLKGGNHLTLVKYCPS